MSKESLVFILGILVFFSPFLGFPREYKEWFFIGAGLVLMFLGYRLRRLEFLRSLDDGTGERKGDSFVETIAHEEEDTDEKEETDEVEHKQHLHV